MDTDSSATPREEKSHTTQTNKLNLNQPTRISNTIKRRARQLLKSTAVDAQSRAVIRYALETDDPCLGEIVRRVDARESIVQIIERCGTRS